MLPSSDYDRMIPYLQSFVYGTGADQKTSFDITQTNPAVRWIFKQLAVENTNSKSTNTTVALYLNKVLLAPSSYMTPTPNGLGVAASGQPYIVLNVTDTLTVALTGATGGDEINVQGLYTEMMLSNAVPY